MEKATRKCPHCGKTADNPTINYCPTCQNILWYPHLDVRRIK